MCYVFGSKTYSAHRYSNRVATRGITQYVTYGHVAIPAGLARIPSTQHRNIAEVVIQLPFVRPPSSSKREKPGSYLDSRIIPRCDLKGCGPDFRYTSSGWDERGTKPGTASNVRITAGQLRHASDSRRISTMEAIDRDPYPSPGYTSSSKYAWHVIQAV